MKLHLEQKRPQKKRKQIQNGKRLSFLPEKKNTKNNPTQNPCGQRKNTRQAEVICRGDTHH